MASAASTGEREPLHISNRSGGVRVLAEAGATLDVQGAELKPDPEGGLRAHSHKASKDVVVRCPPGTDLVIGTVSGSVDVQGPAGAVSVTTVSGRITVGQAERLDVRTKSGTVDVGACDGECNVVVTSSTVKVGEAGRARVASVSGRVEVESMNDAEVKTVSGTVELGARGGGNVKVHTVSGNVEVSVPPERTPETRLKSFSGNVSCDCDQGSDGEVHVKTMSGAIRVICR
jgi:DUF4097 and DUF4098 domain-containing protein YvlB